MLAFDWATLEHRELLISSTAQATLANIDGVRTASDLATLAQVPVAVMNRFIADLVEAELVLPDDSQALTPDAIADSFLGACHSHAHAQQARSKLGNARAMVIGVGGVGSWAAQALAMQGIGNLVLVDPDVVDSSNLYRQPLFAARDVGKLKVEAAADFLRSNHGASVETLPKRIACPDDLDALGTTAVDLVLCCADEPSATEVGRLVSSWASDRGIPSISGVGYTSASGALPVTIIPGHNDSVCFECTHASATTGELIARGMGAKPLMTIGALLGQIVALEAVRVLAGIDRPRFLGMQGHIDVLGLESRQTRKSPRADCVACARLRGASVHCPTR